MNVLLAINCLGLMLDRCQWLHHDVAWWTVVAIVIVVVDVGKV